MSDLAGDIRWRPPAQPAVGHVMRTYLPRSATFVHTTLRFQQQVRPIVLARRTEFLDEFPIDPVVRLLPARGPYHRLARRFPSWAASSYTRRLVRASREHRCSLFHAHFGWAGCDALDACEDLGVPLVTTFYGRDLAPTEAERSRYPRLLADGSMFLCEGAFMADTLVGLGCPHDKIRIVKIGLDLCLFPFEPRKRRRPLVIVQAARFVEKKGVDLSIRAFAAARPHLGPSELLLVGDGETRERLVALAGALGVSDSVRFLGMLSHAELLDVTARAHVCIQPSRTASDGDTEGGAPTVLLEMQASGIPVVSTRHADIPAVVAEPLDLAEEGDVDGLADALVRLAGMSEGEWRCRVEAGRALVEQEHDARRLAERVESLYAEALGAGTWPADRESASISASI